MDKASSISVFIVEDDGAVRGQFIAMVNDSPNMVLAGAAGTLSTARMRLVETVAPDVLIVDLGLPDGDGAELISEMATQEPATSALVVTMFGDESHVVRALEAGAKGYLLKDTTTKEFDRAVRLVYEGSAPLSPKIAQYLLKRFAAPRADRPPTPRKNDKVTVETLTPRETEILQMIAQGKTVTQVAASLFISAATVSTHVTHIYGKLAVNNRVQAINRARATGQLK